MERKTIESFLSRVKPNRYTYYNLDKESKAILQKKYNYLKKHKNEVVSTFTESDVNKILNSVELDFLKKYNAMTELSFGILWKVL